MTVFKILLVDSMATSEENIYLVEYNGDGNVVFVDTEEIDDRHVIYALGDGAGAAGAQRILEQRKYKYVYRKMCQEEFDLVRQNKGLPTVNSPRREKWITEEIGHQRTFRNRGVQPQQPEKVAEFKVCKKQYKRDIKGHMIEQAGSKLKNRTRISKRERPYNVCNREHLRRYPEKKVNVGLKGPENIRAFNETVITVKAVDPHAFKNKNAFTRWVSRNKLGISLATVGFALDAASITMAVLDDKGKWGKHTTMALSSISGGYAGGAIGAEIGAALGSVFPFVGTAFGGFIGCLLGGILGSLGAEAFAGIWVSLRNVVPGPGPPPLMWDLETHDPPPLDVECEVQGPPEVSHDLTAVMGGPDLDFDLSDICGTPKLEF